MLNIMQLCCSYHHPSKTFWSIHSNRWQKMHAAPNPKGDLLKWTSFAPNKSLSFYSLNTEGRALGVVSRGLSAYAAHVWHTTGRHTWGNFDLFYFWQKIIAHCSGQFSMILRVFSGVMHVCFCACVHVCVYLHICIFKGKLISLVVTQTLPQWESISCDFNYASVYLSTFFKKQMSKMWFV